MNLKIYGIQQVAESIDNFSIRSLGLRQTVTPMLILPPHLQLLHTELKTEVPKLKTQEVVVLNSLLQTTDE